MVHFLCCVAVVAHVDKDKGSKKLRKGGEIRQLKQAHVDNNKQTNKRQPRRMCRCVRGSKQN